MAISLQEALLECNLKFTSEHFVVSTVRLVCNHGTAEAPLYFETATAEGTGPYNTQARYADRTAAEKGHAEAIGKVLVEESRRETMAERHFFVLRDEVGRQTILTKQIDCGDGLVVYHTFRQQGECEQWIAGYRTAKEAQAEHKKHVAEAANKTCDNLSASP